MKDATVSARVEYDVKEKAEFILQSLGIPVSVLINALYRQIIFQKGIPFSISIPQPPKAADELSEDELNAELSSGYAQAMRGECRPAKEVFDELERKYR